MMDSAGIFSETSPYGSMIIWPLTGNDQLVSYQLQLIIRKKPRWLLSCYLRFRAGQPQLCLETTGLTPLDQTFSETELCPACGRAVLEEILNDLAQAADLLLPIEQFSLQPAVIFCQPDQSRKMRILLAFWPVQNQHQPTDNLAVLLVSLGQAFRLPSAEIEDLRRVFSMGGLPGLRAHLANPGDNYIPVDFAGQKKKRAWAFLISKFAAAWGKTRQLAAGLLITLQLTLVAVIICSILQGWSWPIACQLVVFGFLLLILILDIRYLATTVRLKSKDKPGSGLMKTICSAITGQFQLLGAWLNSQVQDQPDVPDNLTVLLSANPADFRMALLAEEKPGTPEENEGLRAYILIDEFIVGRDQKSCDLCLSDPGIGRQHARIIRRAGSFFLSDLGSRNGTRLDGSKLLKNVENLLPDQCLIQFADHSFYFQAD
jgi:hypothetical protein